MSFQSLGLSKSILDALAAKNYETPTPIQRDAIPLVLEGRDLLGIAQTGTGKTAAFVLPSIDLLVKANVRRRPMRCRMLVLAPTRELVSQIADNARAYAQHSKLTVATVFGGVPVPRNVRDVAAGVDILVATPGRLLDLIEQRCLGLGEVEILVLDEADQMLDLGFIHALRRIVSMVPKSRQTLFFSATMPKDIRELADKYLTDPATVAVTPVSSTAERVEQYVTHVQQAEKQTLLTMFFRNTKIDRALVFTRTKHGADRVVKLLAANGIASNAIHGNKSQPQREKALAAFRNGTVPIMVATDIAARGIDVSGVSHVVNFELPNVSEQYVHRIGRTARAGASGVAFSFCADDERAYLKGIEKLTKQKVEVVPLPADFLEQSAQIKASRAPYAPDRPERLPSERGPARPRATHAHGAKPAHGRGGPVGNPARGGQPAREGQGGRGGQPPREGGAPRPAAGGARPGGSGGGRSRGGRGRGGGGAPRATA
ncbi:DEAD/DEAH box helicase [Sphingomonas sp. Leaf407]|uniref:DEAD/DEAH box helicase n=1 Tax=unclassified Sphingomonas TaxID=196159 RepID=UPI000701BF9F|nr:MULTISPECIES: DEAD/DEAH box helicase [unclassified Sphingomonas]KQN39647.1 DEAD/DEAH box helicase [Sphingomonas sp. Leaf42]KQT28922.1 DEAD/DEAH box helicase [Sphingomonas sp. Leaf407]